MKNLLLVLLAVSAVAAGCKDPIAEAIKTQEKVYETTTKLGDFNGALMASYQLIALDSVKYVSYYDTITQLHFAMGNFNAAFEAGKIAIQDTAVPFTKEMIAYSAKRMGRYTDAVLWYQELIKDDPENIISYQYQVGECFFQMKNYESAVDFMNKVAMNQQSRMLEIDMRTDNGATQKVPYYLAALNTIAYVKVIKEEYDEAAKIYQDILSKKEDYNLARNNYQLLQQLMEKQAE